MSAAPTPWQSRGSSSMACSSSGRGPPRSSVIARSTASGKPLRRESVIARNQPEDSADNERASKFWLGSMTNVAELEVPTPSSLNGEDARVYARTVYDFPSWKKHRSRRRLIERLLSSPHSAIMQNIAPSVMWCTAVAVLFTLYSIYNQPVLPIMMPATAFSAFISNTAVALSLLLVFRTNASYARWDEARKMWGQLINRSRDMIRQAEFMFPEDKPEAKQAIGRWMIAFVRLLRIHVQPEVTFRTELESILLPHELNMIERSSNRPVKAISMLAAVIQQVKIAPQYKVTMSENISIFQDILGGCERLLRAPIPVSYTRHTAGFLFAWLTALPFALFGTCGIWTAPVVAAIAAVLCGIEEIGVQVEEPFGILPLDIICNRIQVDVTATLREGEETRRALTFA